jgi:integrase
MTFSDFRTLTIWHNNKVHDEQFSVAKSSIWKHHKSRAITVSCEVSMRQARVLTEPEFKRLLAIVAQAKHADRNRLAFMLSHLAGLRVGEIAGLLVGDVFETDGAIRERLVVRASIAKGGHERVVFLSDRLRHDTCSVSS